MNQGFAVVDFETTGLSPAKGDRAIEIGLVHVAPDGTLEDEHETLIHVDRSVGASWVHHITARDLLHAQQQHQAAPAKQRAAGWVGGALGGLHGCNPSSRAWPGAVNAFNVTCLCISSIASR